MTGPEHGGRVSHMTLAVYRVAPDGHRTDIVRRRGVTGSRLDIPPLSLVFPLCRCPRCGGQRR